MQQAINIRPIEKWAFEWGFRFSVDKYKKPNMFFYKEENMSRV